MRSLVAVGPRSSRSPSPQTESRVHVRSVVSVAATLSKSRESQIVSVRHVAASPVPMRYCPGLQEPAGAVHRCFTGDATVKTLPPSPQAPATTRTPAHEQLRN